MRCRKLITLKVIPLKFGNYVFDKRLFSVFYVEVLTEESATRFFVLLLPFDHRSGFIFILCKALLEPSAYTKS